MALLTPFPKFRAFDSNGNPLAGGKLYTFISLTTTPKTTYTDATGTVPNANPTILSANGEADVWLSGTYRFRLDSSLDVVQWTVDGLGGVQVPTGMTMLKATGTVTAVNAATTLTAVPSLLLPANALALGLVAQVTTTFGNGGGLTAIHVGDGALLDRWFSGLSRSAGTAQKSMLPIDSGVGGLSIVCTAAGGTFDATGAMTVSVYYILLDI